MKQDEIIVSISAQTEEQAQAVLVIVWDALAERASPRGGFGTPLWRSAAIFENPPPRYLRQYFRNSNISIQVETPELENDNGN